MTPTHLRAVLLAAMLLAPALAAESLELTVPRVFYGVSGVPVSIYYDNIVLTQHPESYRFEVTCDIGTSGGRRWTVTPEDGHVGDHPMRIVVKDADGKAVGEASTTLRIAPRDAGAGRSLRLLIVGDSLTHASLYPNEIARLLSAPGNPKWTMLGTHKPTKAAPGVAHEGYSGWTWAAFVSRHEPAKTAEGNPPRKLTSPFVYPGAGGDGKPVLDIPRYIREECNGQPPDAVFFLLGINDCFRFNPDDRAALDKSIDAMLDTAEKLLAAFRAAAPGATLAVGLTTPGNFHEAGFTGSYKGAYPRWGWKRIQHRLVQKMIARMDSPGSPTLPGPGPGAVLVPTELNLDPIDGFPANNGVHPNPTGYAQIGASVYAWLKAWMHAAR